MTLRKSDTRHKLETEMIETENPAPDEAKSTTEPQAVASPVGASGSDGLKASSPDSTEPTPGNATALVTTTTPTVMLDEPYAMTVVQQLAKTIPERDRDSETYMISLDDAVATYKLMKPANPAESAICRLVIALTTAGMQSLGRATAAEGLPLSQERDLKLGIKAAKSVAELITVLDSLRGRHQSVNVGQVNVHSGAQAIVGNVSQPKSAGSRLNPCKDQDDEEAA